MRILLALFLLINITAKAQLVNDRTGRFDILKPNANQDVNFKAPLLFDPLDCSGLTTSNGNLAYCDNDEFNLFGNLKVDSTGHIQIPVGTTAQRDANPQPGMYRYNSELETFEGYTDEWGPIAGGGGLSKWLSNEEYEPGKNDTVYFEDNFKIYQTDTLFTSGANFDVSNWNELSKSKSDSNRILNDPGFEYGVSEWSCTNASVSRVTTNTVNDSQGAAEITFSADGGYCELTKDFSSTADEDQKIITSARIKTADDNVFFSYIKNNTDFKVQDHPGDDKYSNFVAQPITQGVTGFRITGNNTEKAVIDDGKLKLGGLPVGVSKNCADELDCENMFTAEVDDSGGILKQNLPFISSINKTGTGTYVVNFQDNIFNYPPSIIAQNDSDGALAGTAASRIYDVSSITKDSCTIKTGYNLTNDPNLFDYPFTLLVSKHPDDYKPLNDRGVVFTESSGGALLSVNNSSASSSQSIGTSLTTVEFGDIDTQDGKKIEKHIDWDTTNNEGTVQKTGLYLIGADIVLGDSNGGSDNYWNVEVDTGSGFSEIEQSPCFGWLGSSGSRAISLNCTYPLSLNKGDKFRIAAVSTAIDVVVRNSNTVNSKQESPRLTVVPILDREYVAAETQKKVKTGVEQWHGEYWDGDKVYEYCNEVASDITTSTTIETIDIGLEPIEVISRGSNFWEIFNYGNSAGDEVSVEYRSSTGVIRAFISGSVEVSAGTRYCLKYTK